MGVGGGTLEFISEMMGSGRRHMHNKKNRKQFQTVELKVRMDCDGCELKVRKALFSLYGKFLLPYFYFFVTVSNCNSFLKVMIS